MTNQNPYQLFLSPRSPFARRVRLALRRLGLPVQEQVLNVLDGSPALEAVNPLGLVPALILPDGTPLSDSSAILETLEDLHGGVWPTSAPLRSQVRQASTLAAGLMQAAVSHFLETRLREAPSSEWAHEHLTTLHRTLWHLDRMRGDLWSHAGALTQAGWDLACALEYLEFRLPDCKSHFPGFADRILREARQSRDFVATAPQP